MGIVRDVRRVWHVGIVRCEKSMVCRNCDVLVKMLPIHTPNICCRVHTLSGKKAYGLNHCLLSSAM